jgi:hypothetical protein
VHCAQCRPPLRCNPTQRDSTWIWVGGVVVRVKPNSQLELNPRCRSKFTERRSRTTDTNAISAAPWQFLFVEYL